jgi:YD repeat-containing protein
MQRIILFLILLSSLTSFCQNEYDFFESYNTEELLAKNRRINSVTELRQVKTNSWKVNSYIEFSIKGLPAKTITYDENGIKTRTVEFVYNSQGQLSIIKTFEKDKITGATEFDYTPGKLVNRYKDYVYSSYDGEKMALWETNFAYNSNRTIKQITRMVVSDIRKTRDTIEVNYFDTSGIKVKQYYNFAGPKENILFQWNPDKTDMKEVHIKNDTISNIVTHKYQGKHEIERLDDSNEESRIYWKYDKQNRKIETNEALLFVERLTYNTNGYLISKSWTVTFPVKKGDPEILRFKYVYKFRK